MSKRIFALIALAAVLALTLTGCSLFGGGDGDGGGDGGDGGGTGTAADSAAITYMADGELFLKQVVGPNTTETTSRPNKAGYTFIGWYADEACTTPFDFDAYFADEAKTDVTVYAGFEEIVATAVTIIYMADGGQFEVQPVDDGVTAPTSRRPGKAGFRFTGWYADEACTQLFDFDAYFAQDEKTSVIVYAGFEVDEDAIIQIIYYVDGNIAHTQNVTAQTSASDADAPHKAGHKFTGWYADAACTKLFDFAAYFASSPRNTVSVYAGFEEIANVLLHYSVDGEIEHTQTVAYDTTESDFADPVKGGYTFIGWFADAACETPFDFVSYFAQTDKAAETTVYAGFKEIIEISYYANGELFDTQTVDDDTTAAIPNEPGKAGYSFAGWYDGKGADAQEFDFDAYFADPDKTDVNVYAHFERIAEDAVQISYFADGQSWRTQTVQGGVATPETIPAPTKEGYIFERWYEDETFKTPSGMAGKADEVTIESPAPSVAVPTKSGYEFIGWFEDEACETSFDYQEFFANYFTAGASDVTVYAGFARVATITYLADGASPATQTQTQIVTSATDAPTAKTPSKPGYDFVGWYLEGEEEQFDFRAYFKFDAERQDVTLHARFEVRTVYIWYYADPSSDERFHTQPVTIDTKEEYGAVPTKQGYVFKAWYTTPECTEEFDFDAYFEDPDKQSVSVYAGYESAVLTTVITYYADGVWFGQQSVTSVDDQQFNGKPVKFAHKFKGWYEDKECTTVFEYDKFMTSSDRGATKSVYAGFELSVDHIDEDGDGICDIDGHSDKVLVYTDNSGLELFDYRIGFISGNAANNSVKNLAQAIPGGSGFNLVGADGYVTLDGNKLTAVGATPPDTPVLLQYIADSRNGAKIAKTVKVHVLNGYTNVSGDWSDLYDAIMTDSVEWSNVVVQNEMTSPTNAQKSDGFVYISYTDAGSRNDYQEAGPSPNGLTLYGNALKWDVSSMIMNGIDIFRIEWSAKTMNITDVHLAGSNASGPNVDATSLRNYGSFFVSNGNADAISTFNITHCLTENADKHYRTGMTNIAIKGSVHRNSYEALIKDYGSTITIEDSVLSNCDTGAIQFYNNEATVTFNGFVDIYNWKNRANGQFVAPTDNDDLLSISNSSVLNILGMSRYNDYFAKENGSSDKEDHYLNLIGFRAKIGSTFIDNAGIVIEETSYTLGSKAYFNISNRAEFNSKTWRDPHATLYDNPSLNYELNFGRS